jgi:hypothetical protein
LLELSLQFTYLLHELVTHFFIFSGPALHKNQGRVLFIISDNVWCSFIDYHIIDVATLLI